MKVCMHHWMRPEPLEVTVARLAEHGYDGIELAADPATMDPKAVGSLLDQHGIACAGSLALLMGGRDLFHEDPYIRAGTVSYLQDAIRLTGELGGTFITVPSTVGKVVPMASAEDEWRWYVDALQACLPVAAEHGVSIVLEPLNRFESYLINRADQAVALAQAAGEDCKVCLDIFHMSMEEADWAQAIRDTGDRLGHFHVADNNRGACGEGDVEWGRLFEVLGAAGYDGWVSVEFMPSLDRTPVSRRAIGDADDADISEGMRQWLRDHGSGVLPEAMYDEMTRDSIRVLREHMDGAQRT